MCSYIHEKVCPVFVNTTAGMINQSIFISNLIIVNSANKSINHRSIVIPWVHVCTLKCKRTLVYWMTAWSNRTGVFFSYAHSITSSD